MPKPEPSLDSIHAPPDIVRELIRRCGSRGTRTHMVGKGWKWFPNSIRHPISGETFQQDAAWDFVADHLKKGVKVIKIRLDEPPHAAAYYFLVPGFGPERIYIKLQLGASKVIGRSFHISNETTREKK